MQFILQIKTFLALLFWLICFRTIFSYLAYRHNKFRKRNYNNLIAPYGNHLPFFILYRWVYRMFYRAKSIKRHSYVTSRNNWISRSILSSPTKSTVKPKINHSGKSFGKHWINQISARRAPLFLTEQTLGEMDVGWN